MKVLALDLEGTLISNAVSVFPRPGLFEFLEYCRKRFDRIVVMTAVSERRFREIARLLADEASAPAWFCEIEYVEWDGEYKDLRAISACRPADVLLVDDQFAYVHPDQLDRWIDIAEFRPPYSADDTGLKDVARRLVQRIVNEE